MSQPSMPAHVEPPLSLLWAANVLLRHRRTLVVSAVLVAAVLASLKLLARREYTSQSSFMPQGRRANAGFSQIAAQFGLSVPGGDNSESPAFYADLLVSREIMSSLVNAVFAYEDATGSGRDSLVNLLEVTAATPALREELAIKKLRGQIGVSVNQRTNVVTFSVTLRHPSLARAVADRLVEAVNRFNLESRHTQAAAERQFAERRLLEVQGELRAAEDRLQQFIQTNRDIRNSPDLQFRQERLQRDVLLRQQVYTTLAQASEQAKIDEVRDTPLITVIEHPVEPARPDPRGLVNRGILGIVLGLIIGVVIAFASEALWRSKTQGHDEYAEFSSLWRATVADIKHPVRTLRRSEPRL